MLLHGIQRKGYLEEGVVKRKLRSRRRAIGRKKTKSIARTSEVGYDIVQRDQKGFQFRLRIVKRVVRKIERVE
jgi:hypothetical protein